MLRPDDTYWLHPDGEGEGKPALEFQAQSAAYWISYEKIYTSTAGDTSSRRGEAMLKLAEQGLVGWANVGRKFGECGLGDLFTMLEIQTIAASKPSAALLTEIDKKKSSLSPRSSQATSAGAVPEASA